MLSSSMRTMGLWLVRLPSLILVFGLVVGFAWGNAAEHLEEGISEPAEVTSGQTFTIQHMLDLERFGRAQFNADGTLLVFERVGGISGRGDFSRGVGAGGERKIFGYDLADSRGAPTALFYQPEDMEFSLDRISPDGEYLIVDVFSRENVHQKGAFSLLNGELELSDANINYHPLHSGPLVDATLVVPVLGEDHLSTFAGLRGELRERLIAAWRAQRDGAQVTASVLGSGSFATNPDRGEYLARIDLLSNDVTRLADGDFFNVVPTRNHTALAALRRDRLALDRDAVYDSGANAGAIARTLIVFDDLGSPNPSLYEPCLGCDVLRGSFQADALRWSPDSSKLLFFARSEGAEWVDAAFFVFDRRDGRTSRIETQGLRPYTLRSMANLEVKSSWLGQSPVLFLQNQAAGEDSEIRSDWYLVSDQGLVNLTEGFIGPTPQLIGALANSLIFHHEGNAWKVSSDLEWLNLTRNIDAEVKPWRAPRGAVSLTDEFLILEGSSGDEHENRILHVIDVSTGEAEQIYAGPIRNSRVVAFSPESRSVAFVERSFGTETLTIVELGGHTRELSTLNDALHDVSFGVPVPIEHYGPNGDDRQSWMLMPTGWKVGDPPVPTIVDIYPGRRGSMMQNRLSSLASSIDAQILAANGYAVLFPSLPTSQNDQPTWPLDGAVEEVFAAVDQAIADGLVDPDRLAVTGHSFGGYAVGGLIGWTDRFKAAIARNGYYNLTSYYGVFDVRMRMESEHQGLFMRGAGSLESGQANLGMPVWRNPELHWYHSPLAYVENISTPVMIIHGDYDYVSMTQAEEFFTALNRLGHDAQFVRYWGEGHQNVTPHNIRDSWERQIQWYDEHLRVEAPHH